MTSDQKSHCCCIVSIFLIKLGSKQDGDGGFDGELRRGCIVDQEKAVDFGETFAALSKDELHRRERYYQVEDDGHPQ